MNPSHAPFGAALLAVLLAGPAFAGDPLVEAPAGSGFNWSGFYAGVDAGYAWGDSTADYFATVPPGVTPIQTPTALPRRSAIQ